MTLRGLLQEKKISVRSYNVCRRNHLFSIEKIIEYYRNNGDFLKLHNCGRKSDLELQKLCFEWAATKLEAKPVEEDPLRKAVDSLGRVQRETINNFISWNTERLSPRAKNGFELHLNGNLKMQNLLNEVFLNKDFELAKLKNIGSRSLPELEKYISQIWKFIIEVSALQDGKDLRALKNKFLVLQIFSLDEIPIEVLESESIFRLADFFIQEEAFFKGTQKIIFVSGFKVYHEPKPLEVVARTVGLTKERVRQSRQDLTDNCFQNFVFLKNFKDDLLTNYNIDRDSDFIHLEGEAIDLINSISKTSFSRDFIIYLLYVYLSDEYQLIGNPQDVLTFKGFLPRDRHSWRGFYLVRKEIAAKFDFENFVNDIYFRHKETIRENYSFNFKSYLSKFIKDNNLEILGRVNALCEIILNEEFDLLIDLQDNITFKRNTLKQVYEYAYEALEALGKPSKVAEIYDKVMELHPGHITKEYSLRVSMKRKFGFVPVGRKSVFGLKKWERELENFKGGTIRQIVEEYLEKWNEPQDITFIFEHVVKYRPKTNQKSVLHNLKMDESGTFSFYKGSKVGLRKKKYAETNLKPLDLSKNGKLRKSWNDRLEHLQSFIDQNKRLPYSANCSEEEVKLYRWYMIQKGRLEKYILTDEQIHTIREINKRFPTNRRRRNSLEKYPELENFILTKKRLPSAVKPDEQILYNFFYNQRKLHSNKKLSPVEESHFVKVISHLKTY